jgi:hypothetical protein
LLLSVLLLVCKAAFIFIVISIGVLQEALTSRDFITVGTAAKAAKAAFQDCDYAEGVAKAEALDAQADAIESGQRAAQEGSEALGAGRAALASGQLDEARKQAGRARERFSTEGLGEVGRKGLEGVGELEKAVADAETKAGHMREGLEVSLLLWVCFSCTEDRTDTLQTLERAEKAMETGQWDESAALIAQAHLHLERGDAGEKERRLAEQLMTRLRDAREASEARARGLEALSNGCVLVYYSGSRECHISKLMFFWISRREVCNGEGNGKSSSGSSACTGGAQAVRSFRRGQASASHAGGGYRRH